MSHRVFTLQFADGLRLYGVVEGVGGSVYGALFTTQGKASDWIHGDKTEPVSPPDTGLNEEPVTFDPDESWSFESRASRSAMWFTGPGNSYQLQEEEPMEYMGHTGPRNPQRWR
jgi:hypothetical protein